VSGLDRLSRTCRPSSFATKVKNTKPRTSSGYSMRSTSPTSGPQTKGYAYLTLLAAHNAGLRESECIGPKAGYSEFRRPALL